MLEQVWELYAISPIIGYFVWAISHERGDAPTEVMAVERSGRKGGERILRSLCALRYPRTSDWLQSCGSRTWV